MRVSLARDLRKHHRTLDALTGLIGRFDAAAWTRPAPDGGWCPAQVYHHIQLVALGFSFKNLEICLTGQGRHRGHRPWIGRLVMTLGRFPLRRIKVDFPPELLPRAISREEAREAMAGLRAMAEDAARRLPDADPDQSAKHFLLGWLRGEEWFRFAEMHHRHHLRGQLRRLLRDRAGASEFH